MMCWETFEMRENKTQMWLKEKKKKPKQEKSTRIDIYRSVSGHPQALSSWSLCGCTGGVICNGGSLRWPTEHFRDSGSWVAQEGRRPCSATQASNVSSLACSVEGPAGPPHQQGTLLFCAPGPVLLLPPSGSVSPPGPPPQFLHRQVWNLTEGRGWIWAVGNWRAGIHLEGDILVNSWLLFLPQRMALPMSPDLQIFFLRSVILLCLKCGILFLITYKI